MRLVKSNMKYEVFCLYINTLMIVDLVRRVQGNGSVVSLCRNALYVGTLGYVVVHAYKKGLLLKLGMLLWVYCILVGVSILVNNRITHVALEGSAIFISRCIPGFYLARYIPVDEIFFRKFRKYYVIMALYFLVVLASYNPSQFSTDGGYMTFSYNILIPALIFILWTIQSPHLLKIALSVCIAGLTVVLGARGPMACMAAAVILFLTMKLQQSSPAKKIVGMASACACVWILFVGWNKVFDSLVRIFPTSRTLYILKTGELFNLSNRGMYYQLLKGKLSRNPLLPHGLYSDRSLLSVIGGSSIEDTGTYAHNLFYEILYQFGGLLGSLVILALVLLTANSFYSVYKSNNLCHTIFLCAAFTGIISLFFSSSYLINERTWVSLGFQCAMFSTARTYIYRPGGRKRRGILQ